MLFTVQPIAEADSFESDEHFSIEYSLTNLRQESGLSKVSLSAFFSESVFGHRLFDLEVAIYYKDGQPYTGSLTIRPVLGFRFPNDRSLKVHTGDDTFVLSQPAAFDLLLFETQDTQAVECIASAGSLEFEDAKGNMFSITGVQWHLFRAFISLIVETL